MHFKVLKCVILILNIYKEDFMSFLRIMAVLFAIAFLAVGVAGFMPNFFQNGLLFGYFEVDTMHNSIHVISGLIALIAATNENYARGFFKVFGLIYAAIV